MWRRRRACWRAPGSTLARSNAARIGRSTSPRRRRWRAPAARRARCTTIARASTRAFSASPAPLDADRRRTTSSRRIRCSARSRPTLEGLIGAALSQDVCAIDGCSAPTWAMPLRALARGFARFGTGAGPWRPDAPRRRRGCAQPAPRIPGTSPAPAGSAPRSCSASARGVFVKTGAEGVYCAALPEQGLGIAVKCDDGAGRAAEVMLAATLARFLPTRHRPRGAGALRAADAAQLERHCGRFDAAD